MVPNPSPPATAIYPRTQLPSLFGASPTPELSSFVALFRT